MKVKKCDRCKITYKNNKKFNMVDEGFGQEPEPGQAIGYMNPPIIDGIIVSSTCGTGKKIDLCDNCISELFNFLNEKSDNTEYGNINNKIELVKKLRRINNYGKQNRIRRIRSKRRIKI